jgi:hypothetical protein
MHIKNIIIESTIKYSIFFGFSSLFLFSLKKYIVYSIKMELEEFIKEEEIPILETEKPKKRGRPKKVKEPEPLPEPLQDPLSFEETASLQKRTLAIEQDEEILDADPVPIVYDPESMYYDLNLKLQNFCIVAPARMSMTLAELQALPFTDANLKKLSFVYQSYNIKTNSAITSKLGGQALNIVSMPVGRWLGCQEELEQELQEDTVLQEKLNELVQSNLSRNELPPAYAIALLYAKDCARAKVKARSKVEKTIEE